MSYNTRVSAISSNSFLTPPALRAKLVSLRAQMRLLRPLLVAYSGGVDSAFLAWVAHEELGADMLAVLADSPSLARWQMRDAVAFAEEQRIPLMVIETREMERPEYLRNDNSRCFYCKDELFTILEDYRQRSGFSAVAYGANVDDQRDFRPGQTAALQHQVAAPLLDAGLSKDEIRQLSREAGLRVWDKPASPCLSSRLEHGRAVTREALSAIERGEDELRRLGFREFRVRHHGELVRIEIAREELNRALSVDMAAQFAQIFKALGFKFVTLDLEGFRSGSMNAVVSLESVISKR